MNQVNKVHELTIEISPQSRTNIVTNTTFFSMDVETGKKVINFTHGGSPVDLTDATVLLGFEFVGEESSKILDSVEGSVVISSPESGACEVVMPSFMYDYAGQVLVHVYIVYEDGRGLDCGVIVTEFEESWLDRDLDEMSRFYVKRFEDLAAEIRSRVAGLHGELSGILGEQKDIFDAFLLVRQAEIEADVTQAVEVIRDRVKAEIIASETKMLDLADDVLARLKEVLEDLETSVMIKEALRQLMVETGEQFAKDMDFILTTAEAIREELRASEKAMLDVTAHIEDEVIHVTADERADWNSKAKGNHRHGVADIEDAVSIKGSVVTGGLSRSESVGGARWIDEVTNHVDGDTRALIRQHIPAATSEYSPLVSAGLEPIDAGTGGTWTMGVLRNTAGSSLEFNWYNQHRTDNGSDARISFNQNGQLNLGAIPTIPANLIGSGTTTAERTATVTHTVTAAEARDFIDNLPQHLMGNITVNILPGTVATDIRINNRRGPGMLTIQAVNAAGTVTDLGAAGNLTPRILIQRNDCNRIIVRGFRCTETSNSAVLVADNRCDVEIRGIDAVAGVSTNADNVGVRATHGSGNVWVRSCRFSNKNRAVWIGVNSPINARVSGGANDTLAGVNNATFVRAETGARIVCTSNFFRLASFGLMTTAAGIPFSRASAGEIIDDLGNRIRPVPSGTATVVTCTPAQVGPLLIRLNNIGDINLSLTINVTPGTTSDTWTIQRRRGTGIFVLRAVDNSGTVVTANNSSTHQVARIVVEDNSNTRMEIQGFRVTVPDNASFTVTNNKCPVHIISCNSISGNNSTADNRFVNMTRGGFVYVTTCTISNKSEAFRARDNSELIANSTAGTNNATLYRIIEGGHVKERNATRAAHSSIASIATGGIFNRFVSTNAGAQSQWAPHSDAFNDLGTSTLRFRDGHFSRTLRANAFTVTSDERVKRDIEEVPTGVANILKLLKPTTFAYENEPEDAPKHLGLLAQQLESSMRVNGVDNAQVNLLSKTPVYSDEGELLDEVLGINLMELVTLLLVNIQAQEMRIERLEKAVDVS